MSHRISGLLAATVTAVPLLIAAPAPSVAAKDSAAPTQITLSRWTSGSFGGTTSGVTVQDGALVLAGSGLTSAQYTDPFGDGVPHSYDAGTWTSDVVELAYPIEQAISSWNAVTPTGTWVETLFRGQYPDGTWSKCSASTRVRRADSVLRLATASSARVVAMRVSSPGQLRTSCRRA